MARTAKKTEELTEGVEAPETEAPKKAAKPKIHEALSFYEKWRVEVESKKRDEDKGPRIYKLTAIKMMRGKIKITTAEAEKLNAQSHNSTMRYYPAGTVTNGQEETIEIDE